MIGYWLLQAPPNVIPGREVACLVSRTLVSGGSKGPKRISQDLWIGFHAA
jgi:hypothetical protein